jgi:hypothetical protein
MKYLIEAFYRSINNDTAVPISYREILLTARIMDDIFTQLDQSNRSQVLEQERVQGALSLS